ncbi:MAG: excinuclease ABC subunit UvrA, partial [Kiritimatiellae bacterium]|nr:excinuclease ABC subunit UvrA [Kiritimatiellia bacterium]
MTDNDIHIVKARMHNLKGIDVTIPRNSLTIVTGLSGSGKSSLAFDTLYAEGQRRYVESLSAYARQFLDRLEKPDVEKIEGLSPAISIEQHTTGGNPRSIVATVTEIHDYLRILYGSVAVAHCPKCGKPVRKQSAEQIVDAILKTPGKLVLYAPVVKGKKGRHEDTIAAIRRGGYARVRIDGETCLLEEIPELDKKKSHNIDIVIDRLVVPCDRTRLTDSVELALKAGKGVIVANDTVYSELNACPDCGISFEELKPRSFSFNSPFGACPKCAGLGQLYFFDEDLIVPDKTLPLEEAIHPWRRMGQMSILYYKEVLAQIARQNRISLRTPYAELPARFRHDLMHGFKEDLVLPWRKVDKPFEGVIATLQKRLDETEDDEMRMKMEAYQNFRTCPDCGGARLRPESRAATVEGKTIVEVMAMPVKEALGFFGAIAPDRWPGMRDILREIVRRLQFLLDVGLDYHTLDRASSTLSG